VYLHRVLPWLAGVVTGCREAYQYLAGSIETFPSGRAMTLLIEGNGFEWARWIPLTGGIVSIYVAGAPGAS
jgi:demethylmenaquinone methyltransferase/2-methoxy-6-polyprenyl-1,4-benzoquinol methylase